MPKSRLAAIGLACLVSGACTAVVQQAPEQTEPVPTPRTTGPPRPTLVRRGQGTLGIAPGHLPGPGYCRVWVEDLPPGRQARARPCEGILPNAPHGSWILYRPASRQQEIRVRYLHETKHGMVVAVHVYEARTGRYLRDLDWGEDDDNMGPVRPTIRRPTTPVRRPPAVEGGRRGQADSTRNRGNAGENRGNTGENRGRGNDGVRADTTSNKRSAQEGGGRVNRRGSDEERGREDDDRRGRRGGDERGREDDRRGNAAGEADTTANKRSGQQAGGQVDRRGGDEEERGREDDDRRGRRGGDDEALLGPDARAPLDIGARNFPGAGQCRVWVPGRPNGRQARAASCDGIADRAPAGAMILRRSPNQPNVILVDYIDEARAGRIVRTSVYDANSGEFIRDERAQR